MGQIDTEAKDTSGALVRSYLDRPHEAVLARGEMRPLFEAYGRHVADLGRIPVGSVRELMHQALGATALHLALMPPDQFSAFTVNLMEPSLNVFVAGDNTEYQITGRVYSQNVKTEERNRFFGESQRPKHEPSRSVLEFDGSDILAAFGRYYHKSIQSQARFFALAPDDLVLVQGLPRVDPEWLAGLDEDSVRSLLEQDLERIEERRYNFRCGCNPQKILMVLRGMFADKADELFGEDDQVETSCPRCGRSWIIMRKEFEARDSKLGFS